MATEDFERKRREVERETGCYTVGHVMAERYEEGEKLYHVKWKFFPMKDATWEPASSIDHTEPGIKWLARKKKEERLHRGSRETSQRKRTVSPDDILNLSSSEEESDSDTESIGSDVLFDELKLPEPSKKLEEKSVRKRILPQRNVSSSSVSYTEEPVLPVAATKRLHAGGSGSSVSSDSTARRSMKNIILKKETTLNNVTVRIYGGGVEKKSTVPSSTSTEAANEPAVPVCTDSRSSSHGSKLLPIDRAKRQSVEQQTSIPLAGRQDRRSVSSAGSEDSAHPKPAPGKTFSVPGTIMKIDNGSGPYKKFPAQPPPPVRRTGSSAYRAPPVHPPVKLIIKKPSIAPKPPNPTSSTQISYSSNARHQATQTEEDDPLKRPIPPELMIYREEIEKLRSRAEFALSIRGIFPPPDMEKSACQADDMLVAVLFRNVLDTGDEIAMYQKRVVKFVLPLLLIRFYEFYCKLPLSSDIPDPSSLGR